MDRSGQNGHMLWKHAKGLSAGLDAGGIREDSKEIPRFFS